MINGVVAELAHLPHEVPVVDDSANGLSAQVVLSRAGSHPAVRLVRRQGVAGPMPAAIAGWGLARDDILAFIGSRGQRDPRRNARRVSRLDGASIDLLVASRHLAGGGLSARMILFLLVSLTGLLVHLMFVTVGRELGAPLWLTRGGAMLAAMSWNFTLNNGLTFRDQRLRGGAMWQGLLGFYVACLGGAMVSEAVSAGLHALRAPWSAAGVVGVLLGAIWNYGAVQRLTWRRLTPAQHAEALVTSLARRVAS